MAVKRTPTQSYFATVEKFKKMNATMDEGAAEIQKSLDRDLNEFTSGASPSGKARLKWLRKLGHPYGRGMSSTASTPTGRKRGAGRKGKAPTLPIGQITGGLRRAKFTKLSKANQKYTITAGFNKGAKGALFAVLPFGTNKMVGRGLWAPTEKGALGKRVKAYRKAFRDTFITKNRQP
jgi:hypothetical protein